MTHTHRAAIIVLDGVGIGAAPDAATYGDVGSDTLGNLSRAVGGLDLPNLAGAGLGNIARLAGVPETKAAIRRMGTDAAEVGGEGQHDGPLGDRGCSSRPSVPDLSGRVSRQEIVVRVRSDVRDAACDRKHVVGSGTAVLDEFGPEHQRAGAWILYTSADSVFQVAAHEGGGPAPGAVSRLRNRAREMLVAPNDVIAG